MVFKLSEPCVQLKFPVLKEQFVFLGFFLFWFELFPPPCTLRVGGEGKECAQLCFLGMKCCALLEGTRKGMLLLTLPKLPLCFSKF